jgi:myo-inositol-1-phosphate synthase
MSRSIKIAVVGVGNCASALVQGLCYYREHPDSPGLITLLIGDYLVD